jgi:hypothetical protein
MYIGTANFNVPPKSNGMIVQKVTLPDGTTYYEEWPVQKGQMPNGKQDVPQDGKSSNDRFSGPAQPGTESGQVQYYPNATEKDFPELVPSGSPGSVPEHAGILNSGTNKPKNWTSQGALPHQVTVGPTGTGGGSPPGTEASTGTKRSTRPCPCRASIPCDKVLRAALPKANLNG